MNFQSFSFPPHVIKHTLNLVERRRSTIKVTDDKVLMNLCSSLEYNVRNEDPRPSIWSNGDWSKTLKCFILRETNSLYQRGWSSLSLRLVVNRGKRLLVEVKVCIGG